MKTECNNLAWELEKSILHEYSDHESCPSTEWFHMKNKPCHHRLFVSQISATVAIPIIIKVPSFEEAVERTPPPPSLEFHHPLLRGSNARTPSTKKVTPTDSGFYKEMLSGWGRSKKTTHHLFKTRLLPLKQNLLAPRSNIRDSGTCMFPVCGPLYPQYKHWEWEWGGCLPRLAGQHTTNVRTMGYVPRLCNIIRGPWNMTTGCGESQRDSTEWRRGGIMSLKRTGELLARDCAF